MILLLVPRREELGKTEEKKKRLGVAIILVDVHLIEGCHHGNPPHLTQTLLLAQILVTEHLGPNLCYYQHFWQTQLPEGSKT